MMYNTMYTMYYTCTMYTMYIYYVLYMYNTIHCSNLFIYMYIRGLFEK